MIKMKKTKVLVALAVVTVVATGVIVGSLNVTNPTEANRTSTKQVLVCIDPPGF